MYLGILISVILVIIGLIYDLTEKACAHVNTNVGTTARRTVSGGAHSLDRFLVEQCRFMDDDLRNEYIKLYKKISAKRDLPPIITFDDIEYELPYKPLTRTFKTSTHIGQRKLFLTELQFLTDLPTTPSVVVYAGAAPSNHTGYLAELFPHVTFILVDPNPFDIVGARPTILHEGELDRDRALEILGDLGENNIYIINSLFTYDLAEAIAELLPECYFISDIRTNTVDGAPDTVDILWNLSQQYNWINIMRPARSMLKFRHPFYNDDPTAFESKCADEPYRTDFAMSTKYGIDFVQNFRSRKLVYLDGAIFIQAWPGSMSTESRLVTSGTGTRDYGTPTEYENKYFYYNIIDRCFAHHANPNADRKIGFDHCNDCAIENILWTNYINRHACTSADTSTHASAHVHHYVKKLSSVIHRGLFRDYHGYMFGYDPDGLAAATRLYHRDYRAIDVSLIGGPKGLRPPTGRKN